MRQLRRTAAIWGSERLGEGAKGEGGSEGGREGGREGERGREEERGEYEKGREG